MVDLCKHESNHSTLKYKTSSYNDLERAYGVGSVSTRLELSLDFNCILYKRVAGFSFVFCFLFSSGPSSNGLYLWDKLRVM